MDSVEVKVLAHAEGIAVFVGTETVLVRCLNCVDVSVM